MCEINNPLGDKDDQEYDDKAVYLIDDGERHWYVGTDAGKALSGHVSLMEPDDQAEFSIKRLWPYEMVTVTLEDRDDFRRYPEHFERLEPDDDSQSYRVRAYAAMWAAHLDSGDQICSSVF